MGTLNSILKPLKYKNIWFGLWVIMIIAIWVVCLIPPPPMPVDLPPNTDKWEHFLGYFILSGFAVQIFLRGRFLLWIGIGLVLMGIGIEFAQGALTTTRQADIWDAMANTTGVLVGLATVFTPLQHSLLRFKG